MATEISISPAFTNEFNSSYRDATFTVTLSAPAPSGGVSIKYRTVAGTATEGTVTGADYAGESGTLTIAAGATSGTIGVRVYGDVLDETDESFFVELSNPVGAVFAGGGPLLYGAGIIQDDDGGPDLALVASNPVVVEGNSGTKVAHVDLLLSRASSTSITVDYRTADGTATAGQDYAATNGSVTFLPGQTSAAIDVPIYGDTALEASETFSLLFSPPAAVASGANGAAALVTILDDDASGGSLPVASIGNSQLTEFNSSYRDATFTVTLSAPAPSGGVSIKYRTVAGTATEGTVTGADYAGESGTLTIAAGATSGTIGVRVYGDVLDETDESFFVELSNPVGAVFAGNATVLRGTGIIRDDDGLGSNYAVVANNASVVEGDAGVRIMHFELLLSQPSSSVVVIPYQTVDGTATAGQDYAYTTGSVTFLPGQTSTSVDVPIYGDLAIESAETFGLSLGRSTSGPATEATSAIGTIQNDDSAANRPVRNDVNGDRRGDLFWQNSDGTPSVWAMQPDGFGASVGAYLNYANPGSSWRLVGSADLNGDGRSDLLWQNSDGTPSGWLVGSGGGSVAGYPVYSNPGASWRLVGGADLDGDGQADLLWQNNGNGAISAWITAAGGTGVSAYVNFQNPGTSWRLVGGGDLNGDGKSDLVFQNTNGAVSAWLMGGSLGNPSIATYANFSNPGAAWSLVGTGDLNGDGRDDLLFQNTQSGLPSGWLMGAGGTSVAGYPTFSNPGTSWHLRGASDANGDGRADLVWQNDSGQPSLWIMGAGGTSVDSYPVLANPGGSWRLT